MRVSSSDPESAGSNSVEDALLKTTRQKQRCINLAGVPKSPSCQQT